ncbi:MAG: hypothetical protein ABR583_07025 [Gaiellaceae bacterium]
MTESTIGCVLAAASARFPNLEPLPVDSAVTARHSAECDYCETYLEQMRQTTRVLGRLP